MTLDDASAAPPQAPPPEDPPETPIEGLDESASSEVSDEVLESLPTEAVAWLASSASARDLWTWLSEDERVPLLRSLTSGFQRTPNALRQGIVRRRLALHLHKTPGDMRVVLEKWKPSQHELFAALDEDDEMVRARLPRLWRRFGPEALVLALASQNRVALLEAIGEIDPSAIEEETEAPGEPTNEANEAAEEVPAAAAERLQVLAGALEAERARSGALQAELSQGRESARKTEEKARRLLAEAQRALIAQTKKAENIEAEKRELDRALERTARKLRHEEREHEEAQGEARKLKRQVRAQQQISEELRKQIAQLNAQLAPFLPPEVPNQKAEAKATETKADRPKVGDSPLDKEFVLAVDGRKLRLTPREVVKRVDANDEDWVFNVVQALARVREIDSEGYKTLIGALKILPPFYSRVLTTDTTRVLIDASNVARYEKDARGKGKLRHLLAMRDELRRRDCFPIVVIADASLPYNIDDADELMAMNRRGEIEITRPGQEADELLAREARRSGAYVVTNDRLFFQKVTPDFEPPRITFRILDGVLIVDEF
jgi:hypothetical protein